MSAMRKYLPPWLALLVGLGAGCAWEEQKPVPPVETGTIATAQLSYELASSGARESDRLEAGVPEEVIITPDRVYYHQRSVRESAALTNFILGLRVATEAYFAELIRFCEEKIAQMEMVCPEDVEIYGLTCQEWIEQRREYERLVCLGNQEIAPDVAAGLAAMEAVVDFLWSEDRALGRQALEREILLAQSIADNMAASGAAPPYRDWGMGGGWLPDADCSGSGGLGATPGGAQDIGYLRQVVEEGYVPLPFHLAVEGLFSEHDLPIEGGGPCGQLLCVKAACGWAPSLDTGRMTYFVQVGFSSGLDPQRFERPALNLAVVLDKSGSMQDLADSDGGLTKIEAVKSALMRMVDKLTSRDRLAIVLFDNSPQVLLQGTPVADRQGIKVLIGGIQASGGTNIEAGLGLGFELVAASADSADQRLDRVMLLTDALPNVGRTGSDSFLSLAQQHADRGIGLSTFGVGFNFGQELVLAISRIRGGNYFFLEDAERIREVFELDFDYLVTPLAYDLHLVFEPAPGYRPVGVYGIPGWKDGDRGAEMNVATLFLSRHRGAIVIRLEPGS